MNVFQKLAAVGIGLMFVVGLVLIAPWLAEKITRRPKDVGDTWPSRTAPTNLPTHPKVDWDELSRKLDAKRDRS